MRRRLAVLPIILAVAVLLVPSSVSALENDVALVLVDAENVKTWNGKDPVLFNFTLANAGTSTQQEVLLAITGKHELWTHSLAAQTRLGIHISTSDMELVLGYDEVANLTFSVKPSPYTLAGSYPVNVTATPVGHPELRRMVMVIVVVPHFVRYHIELADPPPDMTYQAIPPSFITARLALYNTGNAPDRFRLHVSLTQWTWEHVDGLDGQGWTPLLASDITRSSPHHVVLRVAIPASAVAGANATLAVSASSAADGAYEGPSVQVRVEALQYYNFQVYLLGPDVKEALPGETVTYSLRVQNLGNGPDTFSIKAMMDPADEDLFRVWTEPKRATVPGNGSAVVELHVEVMPGTPQRRYFYTVEVRSSSSELSPVTRSFELFVDQDHQARVWTENATLTTRPGGWANLTVAVRNTGNGLDAYIVALEGVPGDWIPYVQPSEMVLLPEESQDVTVSIRLPSTLSQPSLLTYRPYLNVTTGGSTLASLQLAIRLPVIHRVELGTEDDILTNPARPVVNEVDPRLHGRLDLYEGMTTNLSLHLWNLGNVIDNATLSAWTTASGLVADVYPGVVHAGVGFQVALRVEVRVPGTIRPGNYVVWVNASSEGPGVPVRSVPLGVEVVPPLPPTLFTGLSYVDPPRDDYLFRREGEGGALRGSVGRLGTEGSLDILSLQSSLDVATGTLAVTVELRDEVSAEEGVSYYLYFVRKGHVQPGELLSPLLYQFRDLQYNRSSPGSTVTMVHVTFDDDGNAVTGRAMDWGFGDLEVLVMGDKVVFRVSTRDLRDAGVRAGTPLALYAFAERTRSQGGGDWVEELTWDAVGEGAAGAPPGFEDMPDGDGEGLAVAVMALLAVVVAAGALTFTALMRRRTVREEGYYAEVPSAVAVHREVPAAVSSREGGPPEMDGWEEFE